MKPALSVLGRLSRFSLPPKKTGQGWTWVAGIMLQDGNNLEGDSKFTSAVERKRKSDQKVAAGAFLDASSLSYHC